MITLNLLPLEQRRLVGKLIMLNRWRRALWLFFIVVLISIGGLMIEQMWLQTRATSLTQQVLSATALSNRGESGDITRATVELNSLVEALTKATPTPRTWSNDMHQLLTLLPTNITLTAITLDQQGQVIIDGVAPTRSSFLQLQNAIGSTGILKNVATSSTPSTRENVPFHYTALLNVTP